MAQAFVQSMLDFIDRSPTPFHATANMAARFEGEGYRRLHEEDLWQIEPGQGYYVVRNDSSLIAFRLGTGCDPAAGFRMVGAHTDSPCFKLKPSPLILAKGYAKAGIEVYGGVLQNPWFDRDLSLAGRVTFKDGDGTIRNALIDFEDPIAVIPSLAIHLDRNANTGRRINPETDILPLLGQFAETPGLEDLISNRLRKQMNAEVASVLDSELSFYCVDAPRLVGLDREFVTGPRLDNLLSCYVGMESLIASSDLASCLLVCNDHEEIGSRSAAGADGTFLKDTLARVLTTPEEMSRSLSQSLLFSTDNAHGIHPNFPSKHAANHGPRLNEGPVLKVNASQKYATNSETGGFFRYLCNENDVPHQVFVSRADMACGSTIGPISAAALGIRTLDVGVATFGMHSVRETGGSRDPEPMHRLLTAFYSFNGTLGATRG